MRVPIVIITTMCSDSLTPTARDFTQIIVGAVCVRVRVCVSATDQHNGFTKCVLELSLRMAASTSAKKATHISIVTRLASNERA